MKEAITESELGFRALEQEDFEGAVRHLLRASAYRRDPELLYALADAYSGMGNEQEALKQLKLCLSLDSQHLGARWMIAQSYKEQHDYRRAGRNYRRYFSDTNAAIILSQYASTERHLGKDEDAAILYAASLVLEPSPITYNNMALSLNKLGRHTEAVRSCKAGLKLAPGDYCLTINLIRTHREMGDIKAALGLVTNHASSCEEELGWFIEAGNVYSDLDRFDDAIEAYGMAKKTDPTSTSPYTNLGILFDRLDKLEEGETEFRGAIEISPKDAEAHNNLGANLELQGRTAEALAEFKLAVDLDPKNTFYRRNLDALLPETLSD